MKLRYAILASFIGCVWLFLVPCCGKGGRTNNEPNKVVLAEKKSASSIFLSRLDRHSSLIFGSRGGNIVGSDSDQILKFTKGNKVQLTDYSYSVSEYAGTYIIDGEGGLMLCLIGVRRSGRK